MEKEIKQIIEKKVAEKWYNEFYRKNG